jgi:hypothetical protein
LELLALPLPLQPLPEQSAQPAWQTWLNQQTPAPKILLLPLAQDSPVEAFEQTTRWMLANRYFQGSMLNGYSGFFPADHTRVRKDLQKFPTAAGIELLRAKGIEYVVVYHNLAQAPPPEKMAKSLPRVFWDDSEHIGIYIVPK